MRPSLVPSLNGYQYHIHFVDAYFQLTQIYMLKQKSKAFQSFLTFKSQVELQLGYKIKAILQTDWGGECCTSTYIIFSQMALSTKPHVPTLINKIGLNISLNIDLPSQHKTLLPLKYWDEAFRTCVFVTKLPTLIRKNKTPLELLFCTKPAYSQLKVFSYICYPNLRLHNKNKL